MHYVEPTHQSLTTAEAKLAAKEKDRALRKARNNDKRGRKYER